MFQWLHTAQLIHLYLQGKFFLPPCRFPSVFASLAPFVNSLFQMAAPNFEHILVMLKGRGTIPQSTLHCQDGINLGDIRFCPILRTLHMQHISLKGLCTLLSEGALVPLQSNTAPELSRMMVILLVFQVDSEYKRIINVYVGLVVRRVDCCLYRPNLINNFIQDIDVNLWEAHDALKARHDASKRCTYCLFVDNLSGIMSIPTDPPYCLVYPTTYVKGAEPDHFTLRTVPWGCAYTVVCAEPPCSSVALIPSSALNTEGVTSSYHDRLFLTIVELWNHRSPLIDPVTGETCLMEVVGDFRATDPIFKGSYRDSFLYSDDDLV